MNFKITILLILISLFNRSLSAQKESETRNYIKSFRVSADVTLEVNNKYGAVHVSSWRKDSVIVRAEIKAFAPNESKLMKMFDGVSVDITDTKYLVRARTEFSQNINMLFESFKGMTGKMISYDSRIEINYYISAPEYMDVRIENKYGDVSIENITGDLSLTISNGSFKADSIVKGSSMSMSFCDATIHSLGSGKIDASFSEITIGKMNDLTISSISSRFDIEKSGKLRIESRRDKLFLQDIDAISGNAYFTDFRIGNLEKEMDLNARYGNVNTDMIRKGFGTVNVISSSSDISLRFEKTSSYGLDIRYINAFVDIPENENTAKKEINTDKKEYIISGICRKKSGIIKGKNRCYEGKYFSEIIHVQMQP